MNKNHSWMSRLFRCICAAVMLFSACMVFPVSASAAEAVTWDLFSDHNDEAGMYLYSITGDLENPIEPENYQKKNDLIERLYFDFSVIDKNGTGDAHIYRADFSCNGKMQKQYPDFVKNTFVSNSSKRISFDIWLPGQLTRMDMLLELNGHISFLNYERLSFSVNKITCNGSAINTSPSSDYVTSSTGESTGYICTSMKPIDGDTLMDLLTQDHVTQKQYQTMIESGKIDGQDIRDSYFSILEGDTLKNLQTLCDGDINQSFSHSDEQSYYYYTLNLEVYNPINTEDADLDALNTFYFDFDYIDQNGYGQKKKYRLDMSWSKTKKRNLNPAYADLFRAGNDNGYDLQIGLWIPGIVQDVHSKLNMDGGERLGVTIHSINLAGFRINPQSDYVSSSYYDSKAEIPCSVPDAQIDLSSYSKKDIKTMMQKITQNKRTDLKDQYGSYITDLLWDKAYQESKTYFETFANRSTPQQLIRSSKYIEQNAMSETIYHAQTNDNLQKYMTDQQKALAKK